MTDSVRVPYVVRAYAYCPRSNLLRCLFTGHPEVPDLSWPRVVYDMPYEILLRRYFLSPGKLCTRGNRTIYTLLPSLDQKVSTKVAVPAPDKTMEKVLSPAEETSSLTDDASCEVERLLIGSLGRRSGADTAGSSE